MAKVFSIKKHRLRAKARRRRHSLKIGAPTMGLKNTWAKRNHPVIAAIEAKMKAQA